MDFAEVREAPKDRTSISRFNGEPAILLSINPRSHPQMSLTFRAAYAKSADHPQIPPTRHGLVIAEDQGPFIVEALADLKEKRASGKLASADCSACGIAKCAEASLIMISIPVSVIATMGFMAVAGITLNFHVHRRNGHRRRHARGCVVVVLECFNVIIVLSRADILGSRYQRCR